MQVIDDPASVKKSANVVIHQNWRTLFNSLVICLFSNISPESVLDLINTACGLNWTLDDMLRCGERGWNLKRAINNRLGLSRVNDRLPKALLEPYPEHSQQRPLSPTDFEIMLAAYYQKRGWDPVSGFPTAQKLSQLGLDFVIPDLWQGEREP